LKAIKIEYVSLLLRARRGGKEGSGRVEGR